MKNIPVAIYARVSSDQQTEAHTIASQLAALRARVAADGFALPPELQVMDEGYSGATLVRPGLERLRDLIAAGGVERLYVHSPDRLARKYAYQVLLMDEFQRAGVEVVFLNRELGRSPEDELLLQVQGMVAEYERAKILERSRRGKRHAAHAGVVSVLCGAPYGYHYISKQAGGGVARFDIVEHEARVVRQVFTWVGQERVSIGEVCRRLQRAREPRRDGKTTWDRSVVWGMLKNPAYQGMAGFGKTRVGALKVRLRAQRGRGLHPRRPHAREDVPREEWIFVPVPAIIDSELYDTVQEQLTENRRRARQGQRGARYVLQGLLVCKVCGYAYYGKAISPSSRKGHPRAYAYYRCLGTDAYRFGGQRICPNTQVRTDLVELAVWQEVCRLLEHPQRLEQEYRRRGQAPRRGAQWDTAESLRAQSHKLRQGIARLIDSYAEGLIGKEEFEPRITQMKQRVTTLEERIQHLADEAAQQHDLRLIISHLEDFVAKVSGGLAAADWLTRREIMRALVRRVEIDKQHVTVVFRVPPTFTHPGPDGSVLPDCRRRAYRSIVPTFPLTLWSKPGVSFGNEQSPISSNNAPAWCCSSRPTRFCPMSAPPPPCTSIPTPCAIGGEAGPGGSLSWRMPLAEDARPGFPPLDQALVKAVACEAVHHTGLPLSRLSTADIAVQASKALGKPISPSTVWRILAADAIKPWRYKYWIFPRDPHFAEKAGRVVDLYAGYWQGEPLGPKDYILSADEKTSIQARLRCHPSLPPAPGRVMRIEHEYERGGALQYLVAWDVRRGLVMGRCEPSTGIEPFGRLVAQVMERGPYNAAERVFWVVDNGSSHRGEAAVRRLTTAYANLIVVHTPVHASWLNQVEIYFSIV